MLQAQVTWARAGSGFTLMMEAKILFLSQQMSSKTETCPRFIGGWVGPDRSRLKTIPNSQRTYPRNPSLPRNPAPQCRHRSHQWHPANGQANRAGFCSFHYFRVAAYLEAGCLNLEVSHVVAN